MSTSKGKEVDSSAGDDEEELVRPEKFGANIATINYLKKRIAKPDVSASKVSAVEAAVNCGFDKLTDHLTALPGQLASAITQLNHKGHSQAPMQEPRLNGSFILDKRLVMSNLTKESLSTVRNQRSNERISANSIHTLRTQRI